jgi:AraC family transcriptional regulator, arabinose operon regulatory protein
MVTRNKNICDINMMPASCKNRFIPLWSENRQDVLAANGIMHSGLGENRKGYAFGRKNPDFHLILFTRKGEGMFLKDDGSEHSIHAGDLAIFPAHVPHYYAIRGDRWDHLWFHITDTSQWQFLKSTRPSIKQALYLEDIEQLLVSYYREALRDNAQSGNVLWHLGEAMLHYLRSELKSSDTLKSSEADKRCDQLIQAMRSQPEKKWTLAEISDLLCFSKMHAIRFFKAHTGRTPFEFLAQCRMQLSAHHLLYSTEKIQTIAERVGYTDQFAFSAAFSRFHQCSPREFRKRKHQSLK